MNKTTEEPLKLAYFYIWHSFTYQGIDELIIFLGYFINFPFSYYPFSDIAEFCVGTSLQKINKYISEELLRLVDSLYLAYSYRLRCR